MKSKKHLSCFLIKIVQFSRWHHSILNKPFLKGTKDVNSDSKVPKLEIKAINVEVNIAHLQKKSKLCNKKHPNYIKIYFYLSQRL